MDLNVRESNQFKIKELTLVTKAGPIDISSIFVEINIYDSLLLPVINGSVSIIDSVGLSSKLIFDGSEAILINIAKDADSDIAEFKRSFRIYKQTNRQNENQSTESYILHFCSDELLFSDQQRINQSYTGKYSDIVEKILINYLKVRENNLGGIYENSVGLRKVVIPNLRPLDAIDWCTKRAVDIRNSPNFMFWQNL